MPANPPDPSRRNEQSRRAILEASIALINELGYANVSIEAIARRAGVGKQTIYRWWPSKGAVVLEAATQSLDPVVAFPDTGDFVADLRTQLNGIVELISTTGFGSAYQGLIAAGQSDPDLMRAISEQVIEPSVRTFSERCKRARERGEVRGDCDTGTLRDVLYGLIEYRLLHAMPIQSGHIDALLEIAFPGVWVLPPDLSAPAADARRSVRSQNESVDLPVLPPVSPMLAKAVTTIPADCSYEPKWDGFRSILFRDGDEVELGSRNERPLTRYFPELVAAARAELPDRCVIDGEIVIATDRGLDFETLQLRLHPAASRVAMLAEKTPASFIAFDLLALGGDDYTGRPFSQRRGALEIAMTGAGRVFHLTPATTDVETARRWFHEFEGAGLDGLIAKPLALDYQPDKRLMFKVKHQRTADCVVAGYRLHKSGDDAVGSLMLGLYDDDGRLASVGVIGAFPMATRRALFADLQELVTTFDDHPWNWAAQVAQDSALAKNVGSRWNAGKDLSFVPLRPQRVVEVRYDHMEGQRFRHTAQFNRWRPDRDPGSCTYAQLEQPLTYRLGDIVAGLG